MGTGNYSATSNNTKFAGRWWVGCYIWYSEEGTGRGNSPPINGQCTDHRITV